jgi:stage II sporulation protein AA (anti-sigma F factor antagonist)
MSIELEREKGVLIARLSGELDSFAAAAVREKLDAALRDEGINRLEFDLEKVGFMDSSGIGVLLGRYRSISKRGGTMGVKNAGGSVEKLLRMSGVYTLCSERSGK